MTAAIFNIGPEQVIIAMDTLAMSGDTGNPYFFTTKLYPLPHLQGVMFATGIGDLATKWFVKLERFLARDIHHLDQYVTPPLQELGMEFNLSEAQTTTIYHIGYSEAESRYVGFAYRSTNSFRSERLEYGLRTKPGIPDASVNSFPSDFIRLMEAQRTNDAAVPLSERVFIGGEIQALILANRSMTIQTIHRFSDYEALFQRMCDGLPANKT
ncbi:hypothetical protein [Cupriavidus oxalaticus]|uniref:hypothetical protein n=1 Tax=Cupriavidus oxalaticus TaxID=96344 RepID=UPI00317439CF